MPAGSRPQEEGHVRGQRVEAPVLGWYGEAGRRAGGGGGLRHRSHVLPRQARFPVCQAPCATQTATEATGADEERHHPAAADSPPGEDG